MARANDDKMGNHASCLPCQGKVTDEVEPDPQADAAEPAPLPWVCYPLLGINLVFDGLSWLLGPAGRWLRRPGGRAVLGGLGLLLLAAAVARGVLDWMGWTW